MALSRPSRAKACGSAFATIAVPPASHAPSSGSRSAFSAPCRVSSLRTSRFRSSSASRKRRRTAPEARRPWLGWRVSRADLEHESGPAARSSGGETHRPALGPGGIEAIVKCDRAHVPWHSGALALPAPRLRLHTHPKQEAPARRGGFLVPCSWLSGVRPAGATSSPSSRACPSSLRPSSLRPSSPGPSSPGAFRGWRSSRACRGRRPRRSSA